MESLEPNIANGNDLVNVHRWHARVRQNFITTGIKDNSIMDKVCEEPDVHNDRGEHYRAKSSNVEGHCF